MTPHDSFSGAIEVFDDCTLTCAGTSAYSFALNMAVVKTTSASQGLIFVVGPSAQGRDERGTFDLLITTHDSMDASTPQGCVSPNTPGFVTFPEEPPYGKVGTTSVCNASWQYYCEGACTCQGCSCGSNGSTWAGCDGPEDCPPGQACVVTGAILTCLPPPASCGMAPMMGTGDCHLGVDSSCVCHSDADCPSDFPYCYPDRCGAAQGPAPGGAILCHATPPPADAGVQYVSCTLPNAVAPNYGVACGSTTCTSETEECCISAGTSTCQPRSAACPQTDGGSVPSLIVQCDGPEDCPFGTKCCEYGTHNYSSGHVVFCGGDCPSHDMIFGGGTACHTSADCPAAFPTCAASDGGPVSFCQ